MIALSARLAALAAATGILLAAPALASAATTLGDTVGNGGNVAAGPVTLVQTTDPATPKFIVQPGGGGVVTSVAARVAGSATVLLLRPDGANFRILGRAAVTGASGLTPSSAPTRISVQPGDRLGAWLPAGSQLLGGPYAGSEIALTLPASEPVGDTLDTSASAPTGVLVNLSAEVEPDADGDGYGDETQDSCPQEPGIASGQCIVDLSVNANATSLPLELGETVAVRGTVSSIVGSAPDATLALSVSSGLTIVGAMTSGGECERLTCTLGGLSTGTRRSVLVVVRADSPGTHGVGMTIETGVSRVNVGDDAASVPLSVNWPQPPAAPGPVPAPAVPQLCKVPKLKGKTKAAATTALTKAGCKLGKITGAKSKKKAKVKSQTVPSGLKVQAGTKVGFRLA